MATDVEIKGKISIDNAVAAKSINEMNKAIGDSKKALKDAKVGSEEYTKAKHDLEKAEKELKRTTDEANKSHKDSGEAFGILKEKVHGIVPELKEGEEGVKRFGTTLKALAMNPIALVLTALVAVLTFLYKAFTSTREGAEKLEAIFSGVEAVIDVVVDRVMKMGQAIIKFFSGDFKGAAESAKGAVTGIVDEAGRAYTAAKEITEKLQALKVEEMADSVNQSKRKANLAELKAIIGDEEVSAKEKVRIANEVVAAAKENAAGDIGRAEKRFKLEMKQLQMKSHLSEVEFQAQFDLQTKLDKAVTDIEKDEIKKQLEALRGKTKLSSDEFEKQFKLQIDYNNVVTEINNEIKASEKAARIATKQSAAEDKAVEADKKAKQKEAAAAKKEAEKKVKDQKKLEDALEAKLDDEKNRLGRVKFDLELMDLKVKYDAEIKLAEKNKGLLLKIEENYRRKQQEVMTKLKKESDDKAAKEAKMPAKFDMTKSLLKTDIGLHKWAEELKTADADFNSKKRLEIAEKEAAGKQAVQDAYMQAADAVANAVGRNTLVGKGISAAIALINTFQGISAGVKLGYPMAIPAVILAAATGFAAVKNILAVQVPGQSSGSGLSVPSVSSVVAPILPHQTSTRIDSASTQAIGNAAAGGVNGRAFVLDADIRHNAERNERINRAARLG